MDVIGVYAAGVTEVVASCGTALTNAQVRMLKRHSSNITVNFDPDAAGENAAERSIKLLLDEAMHVRIMELDEDLDPDEYCKKHGRRDGVKRVSKPPRPTSTGSRTGRCLVSDAKTSEGRVAVFPVSPCRRFKACRINSIARTIAMMWLWVSRESREGVVRDNFLKMAEERERQAVDALREPLPEQEIAWC